METKVRHNYYIVIDEIDGMTLYYSQMNHVWTPDRAKGSAWLQPTGAEECLVKDSEVNKFPSAKVIKVRTTVEEVKWIGEG